MSQDTFKVFISHKSDDAVLAEAVATELKNLVPDRIECWVSGQDLAAGADWEREIKQTIILDAEMAADVRKAAATDPMMKYLRPASALFRFPVQEAASA